MRDAILADRSPGRLSLLDGRARAKVRALRGLQVELGRVLLELKRADRFVLVGSTTFPLYCEGIGLSTLEGKELTALAEAAETRPEVAAKVAEGKISVQKGAAVAEVVLRPELARAGGPDGHREGDVVGAWLEKAETTSGREIRDLLRKRKEEARLEAPPVELRLWVSERGKADFGRCRELVSRSKGAWVTEGQTLEGVCEDYLGRHDPERKAKKALGAGRGGDSQGRGTASGSRGMRAVEKQEALSLEGDAWAIEGRERRAADVLRRAETRGDGVVPLIHRRGEAEGSMKEARPFGAMGRWEGERQAGRQGTAGEAVRHPP